LLGSGGFASDAFGLSRTAGEAFISLRYIENKDSEVRAKRYIDYFAKDRENLTKLIDKHHPHLANSYSPDHVRLIELAKQFKSPHKWFEAGVTIKEAACEESTWATDLNGEPERWEYGYDVVYKFTSHEVHATSVALWSRIKDFYTNSNYPSAFKFSKPEREANADTAIVNVCIALHASIEHLFHAFDMQVPTKIREAFGSWQKAAGIG
jgi:Family of unknown function (DUF5677)